MTEQERIRAAAELAALKATEREQALYIKANVFRDADGRDCTLNGETSRFNELYVSTLRMSRNAALLLIEERHLDAAQCVQMENRNPCGEDYFNAVPLAEGRRDKWHMMGGNFIYTSDSRFVEVTHCRYHVPVHDRIETTENSFCD